MERWVSIGLFVVAFVAAVGAMAFTFWDDDLLSMICGAVAVIVAAGGLGFALKDVKTRKQQKSEETEQTEQP